MFVSWLQIIKRESNVKFAKSTKFCLQFNCFVIPDLYATFRSRHGALVRHCQVERQDLRHLHGSRHGEAKATGQVRYHAQLQSLLLLGVLEEVATGQTI